MQFTIIGQELLRSFNYCTPEHKRPFWPWTPRGLPTRSPLPDELCLEGPASSAETSGFSGGLCCSG
jgi:hypothetical protein